MYVFTENLPTVPARGGRPTVLRPRLFLQDSPASVPGVRVHVLVRVKEPDLGNRDLVNPKAAEDPLVLRAEPDLAGHPGGKRQGPDLAELVCQQVFVKRVRVDVVAYHPDFHEKRVRFPEGDEIVRERRVVRVLLPPVPHPLSKFFCIADGGGGFWAAGHFMSVGWVGLMGLWLSVNSNENVLDWFFW